MYYKKFIKTLNSQYIDEYNSLKKHEIEISCSTYQNEIFKIEMGRLYNFYSVAVYIKDAAKLLQSCLTLCDPIDGSPPGSPVPGILQARTLEWVTISFSNA